MADNKQHLSAGSSRLLPLGCLLLTVAVSTVTVCWVWQIQTRVDEILETMAEKHSSYLSEQSDTSELEMLKREVRDSDQGILLEGYLSRIAALQLKSLQTSCAANERLCMQGPKGETGVKGNPGDRGVEGMKGDRGQRGERGPPGPKGEPGTLGSRIAAPVIVNPPKNVMVNQGQTAVLQCEVDGYPKPDVHWHKVQSTLPLSRTSVSENGSLVIRDVHRFDAGSYACRAETLFGTATAYASMVVLVPPQLRYVPPKRVVVVPDEKVVLRCSASGYPKPRVSWIRPVLGLPDGSVTVNGTLTIPSVKEDDLGQYICEAKNSLSKKTYSVILAYGGKIKPSEYGVEVQNATDLQLQCKWCAVAGSKFTFTWKKIGGQLPDNRTSTRGCSLFISEVTMEDAGRYSCIGRAVDSVSETSLNEDITVIVMGGPRITSNIDILRFVRPGNNITFNCSAIGPPQPQVYWIRGSQKLVVSETGSAALTFTSVSKQNEGEYVCRATNYLGEDQISTTLFLVEKSTFIYRPTGTLNVARNANITINCTATGQPQPKIIWKMPCGRDNTRARVLSNGTLVISGATIWDTGMYECVAFSLFGNMSSKIHVVVPSVDRSWKLSDSCSGWRQSRYNNSVYYAASSSTTWDQTKYYYCPTGYHWACTKEGKEIFKDNNNWSGQYTYYSQCGWRGDRYPYYGGSYRYYFRFRDSVSTNAHKYSSKYEEHQLEYASTTSNFAGAVCIKNSQ